MFILSLFLHENLKYEPLCGDWRTFALRDLKCVSAVGKFICGH